MKNYTCSSCGFSMNARNQPGSCPACGHVDKSLRKKKPQGDPTIPSRLIRATAVIQGGGSYADFVKALNPQGKGQ